MDEERLIYLRLVATPYIGETLIYAGVTVFLFYVAFSKRQWEFLWAVVILWLFHAIYVVLFGLRYRILWNDTTVVMRASGGPERRIPFDEIAEINYDVAASQSRPFRRLVIHPRSEKRNSYVDVSLRHFRMEDINSLLAAIHQRRPDLMIPEFPGSVQPAYNSRPQD